MEMQSGPPDGVPGVLTMFYAPQLRDADDGDLPAHVRFMEEQAARLAAEGQRGIGLASLLALDGYLHLIGVLDDDGNMVREGQT